MLCIYTDHTIIHAPQNSHEKIFINIGKNKLWKRMEKRNMKKKQCEKVYQQHFAALNIWGHAYSNIQFHTYNKNLVALVLYIRFRILYLYLPHAIHSGVLERLSKQCSCSIRRMTLSNNFSKITWVVPAGHRVTLQKFESNFS